VYEGGGFKEKEGKREEERKRQRKIERDGKRERKKKKGYICSLIGLREKDEEK
jgi:hypothetical protein